MFVFSESQKEKGSLKAYYSQFCYLSIQVWLTVTPFESQNCPRDLPNPGIEPRSPALQADSLPAESPGKPVNTGVSSLSFLQGIFPTQKLNQDLLHCRQILYQLSYQGSPKNRPTFGH